MKTPKWGGRKAQAWTRAVLHRYGRVCALKLEGCTGVATTGDHKIPRSVDLSRQYDVANGQPACEHCNKKRQANPLREPVVVDARHLFEKPEPPRKVLRPSPPRASHKTGATP